jgi:hypothetical protein
MQFKFLDADGWSSGGYLAFTTPITAASRGRHLLLVADVGANAVHLVDVVSRRHAGYLASPGSIPGPRGVAASATSPLVAVSAWKRLLCGDHVVVVFRGSGALWEVVRVIGRGFGGPGEGDGQLKEPFGLRFSGDGSVICVADAGNNRTSVFRVGDGGFVRHIATGLRYPRDVVEVEGGWLVVCSGSSSVEFVGDGIGDDGVGRPSLGKAGGGHGSGDGEFNGPTALAMVLGLGLVVREHGNDRLQVFVTPDTIAMAAMSRMRVAWLVAVARAALHRSP